MKLNKEVEKIKKSVKSVRIKLFLTLCITISAIILLLVLINTVVLEKFYLYNKTRGMINIYEQINDIYNHKIDKTEIGTTLENISIKNNLDILIKSDENIILLESNNYKSNEKNESEFFEELCDGENETRKIFKEKNVTVKLIKDVSSGANYIVSSSKLDNGLNLYMATPTGDLQESARISNNVLITVGSIVIIVSGIISSFVSKRFTAPIVQLNTIAQKMSNLDFSQKYQIDETDDEINNLGNSINIMSDKLEKTIKQLTVNNSELEKDIEKKSKIDEMRKQFISDVSHELKTPIALIQGYAEGLVENVNTDDESREFYANVILDEANKMDRLVKQLLELMSLEYGKREFNNENFDIVALVNEVIRKSNLMLQENEVKINFEEKEPVIVYADSFYIEQVVTNYVTNAIKYSEKINDEKKIVISIEKRENNKIRVNVFNSGNSLDENELQRIWGRFYKIDQSRNRDKGGTGIGLSFVKAIMNNYQNDYGAMNKDGGLEFYFELNEGK